MADHLTSQIQASINWLFREPLDLTVVTDSSKLVFDRGLEDGIAANEADKVWHDSRTLAAGAHEDLNLSALTHTIFGSTVTIALAQVKALLIINRATIAGADLIVGGAASQEWTAWVGGAGDKVRVPADSSLLITNCSVGWTVTLGSSDSLRIANPSGEEVTYRIAILGCSA